MSPAFQECLKYMPASRTGCWGRRESANHRRCRQHTSHEAMGRFNLSLSWFGNYEIWAQIFGSRHFEQKDCTGRRWRLGNNCESFIPAPTAGSSRGSFLIRTRRWRRPWRGPGTSPGPPCCRWYPERGRRTRSRPVRNNAMYILLHMNNIKFCLIRCSFQCLN